MKATVLDTVTGKTLIEEGIRVFEWAENNWSCDCNRDFWGVLPDDAPCQSERFLVIAAEFTEDDFIEGEYTLEELNDGYPPELLAAYLPPHPKNPWLAWECALCPRMGCDFPRSERTPEWAERVTFPACGHCDPSRTFEEASKDVTFGMWPRRLKLRGTPLAETPGTDH